MIGILIVTIARVAIVATLAAGCGRGARTPGRSWFDIPHDAGRTARRQR